MQDIVDSSDEAFKLAHLWESASIWSFSQDGVEIENENENTIIRDVFL